MSSGSTIKQRNISLGAQFFLLHKTTFIPQKGLAQFDAADAIHKDIASIKLIAQEVYCYNHLIFKRISNIPRNSHKTITITEQS